MRQEEIYMNLDNIIAETAHKTVYRDGKEIIKVFSERYSKAMVLNEALNTAQVEESGLNIPRLHAVTMVDGKWAIVSDFIEGKTLQQLMDENPDREDEYLGRFVAVQMSMHRHSNDRLTSMQEKLSRHINESGLGATTRYELHTRLDAMRVHQKICHGDFVPSNVIITPDDRAYILDWNHATKGNASGDVAMTYLLLVLEGKEKLAEKYLNLFCKKSDTAKQYVQKWIPIVAAAQLSNTKYSDNDRKLMHSWADVMDFQ